MSCVIGILHYLGPVFVPYHKEIFIRKKWTDFHAATHFNLCESHGFVEIML